MLFYMLLFLALAMIPAGVVFGILLLVEVQKRKRMQRLLNSLAQSGKISQAEYYTAVSGKSISPQMYTQAQQPQSQAYAQPQQPQPMAYQQPVQAYKPPQPQTYQQAQPQIQQPVQPQVQQPVQPQYMYSQPPMYPIAMQPNQDSKKTSSANFLLVAGMFLVILSGIIFATTTWEQLISPVKVSLLFLASAIFFGVSVLAHKKFGLKQTGVAFYSLGSVFLPVAVLAIGFLELFGSWLSFYGRGGWLLGVIASVPLGIAFFFGYKVYKKPVLYWLFFFSIAVGVSSVSLFISNTVHMLTLGITVFSIVLILLSHYCDGLSSLKAQAEVFFWISAGLGFVSGVNSYKELIWRSYIDVYAIIAVALICLIFVFKVLVEKSDIAKYLSPIFILLFFTQCFVNIGMLIDKSAALYFSVAITATAILFELLRDNDNVSLLRSLASDIIFCSAIFLSTFMAGNSELDKGIIWLCLFVLLSLFGQKQRAWRFLRPIPLYFFGYMLTVHFSCNTHYWPIFAGTLLLFVFAAFPPMFLSGKGQYLSDSRLSFLILGGITGAILQMSIIWDLWVPSRIPLFICTVALLALGVAIAYYNKNLFVSILPMLFVIPLLSIGFAQLLESAVISLEGQTYGYFIVLTFLLFMATGRLLHKKLYASKMPDIFTISAFVAPLCLFLVFGEWWRLAGWLMLGVYGFSFLGRIGNEKAEKVLALLGSIAVCMGIYTQSIFDWNDAIQLKVFLLLPFLVLLLCRFWLFSTSKSTLGVVAFGYGIFTAVVLLGEAMISSRIFDALFLGISAIIVIVISFMKKSKRWFFLSCITTIAVAIYLSRSFWASLAWWVYLLVGGAILIAIAVMAEINRHSEKSLKKNVFAFFEDWN